MASCRNYCDINPNCFWHVCAHYRLKMQQRTFTPTIISCHGAGRIFCISLYICPSCDLGLRLWLNGHRKSKPFGISMLWSKSRNHIIDSYFCLTNATGYSPIKKEQFIMRTYLFSDIVPVPVCPSCDTLSFMTETEVGETLVGDDDTYRGSQCHSASQSSHAIR